MKQCYVSYIVYENEPLSCFLMWLCVSPLRRWCVLWINKQKNFDSWLKPALQSNLPQTNTTSIWLMFLGPGNNW